jgi:hemerythrin-like domain-containing protein
MRELTQQLRDEHRHAERLLRVLDAVCDRCEAGEPIDAGAVAQLVALLRDFLGGSHRMKEEALLLPALERGGISGNEDAVGRMRREHELESELIGMMESAARDLARGEPTGADLFSEAARRYAELMVDHISKEDQVVFRMADRLLSPATKAELAAEVDRRSAIASDPSSHAERIAAAERRWLGPVTSPGGRPRSEPRDRASEKPVESCR